MGGRGRKKGGKGKGREEGGRDKCCPPQPPKAGDATAEMYLLPRMSMDDTDLLLTGRRKDIRNTKNILHLMHRIRILNRPPLLPFLLQHPENHITVVMLHQPSLHTDLQVLLSLASLSTADKTSPGLRSHIHLFT